ncbi:MAG TPA: response regulator transcription factor [Chloroflexi bacterium]|nr:response regulator transcription factor [Chloroflexota bacterium]
MPETRVLVVDDEKPLRDFVRRNLEVRGYQVEVAANGLEALALFGAQPFDLIILDLMMPHMDGLETTRRIRQNSIVPIIVLTALGEEGDKIAAFEMGADDYLTKPFGVEELLARVRAVLRRASWSVRPRPVAEKILRRAGVRIDLERREVSVDGVPIELTPTEFDLLCLLASNPGIVLTHRDLLQRIWGPEYGDEVEYVRVYIGRLRRKLERDPSKPRRILTERGVGYRFTSG